MSAIIAPSHEFPGFELAEICHFADSAEWLAAGPSQEKIEPKAGGGSPNAGRSNWRVFADNSR
jgi:hypothetical protein